jgi:hypothetical protein
MGVIRGAGCPEACRINRRGLDRTRARPQMRGRANGRRHSGDAGLTSSLCWNARRNRRCEAGLPDAVKRPGCRRLLSEAERAASEATEPVMLEEAERVATYLVAARREVWRLEAQVNGLAETWISGREGPRPVRLSRKLLDALSPVEPQYPPSMRPEIKQTAAWRAFHTALLANPETT